jgi:hypothetical protein
MDNRHNVECCASRFHHQAVDDGDANRTKRGFVSKAKPT